VTVTGDALMVEAARISAQLTTIRRTLHETIWTELQQHPVPLTPPQVHAMQLVVERARDLGTGPSLSELTESMGLAQSTVSGIVTRLERLGLLQRVTRSDDRRSVRVELTRPVVGWIERDLAAMRLRPLAAALGEASSEERTAILEGLATLERLLVHG
jgi:DNA-binding MarR family transcriptional regulator